MGVPRSDVLQRPKLAVAIALMLLTALAWLLLAGGSHPPSAGLAGLSPAAAHDHAHVPGVVAQYWSPAHWFTALFMWLTMTVAMMLPTAALAILSIADRDADATTRVKLGQTGAFVAGYLVVWWSFGVLATALQWLLASSLRGLAAEAAPATALAGCLLVLAGLYQFSAPKRRCLAHCRGPLSLSRSRWQTGALGAHYSGLRHGIHCLGCCWALMGLMLLSGAMNLGWMAALAGLMLVEKILPGGLYLGRAAGIGLIGWGSVLVTALWS
jgi:predicted metal-binding membrane protein